MNTTYTPQTQYFAGSGDGVPGLVERCNPSQARRIEALGRLNDRRMKYLAAGDKLRLLELAQEYEDRRMPKMAAEVRKEAGEL